MCRGFVDIEPKNVGFRMKFLCLSSVLYLTAQTSVPILYLDHKLFVLFSGVSDKKPKLKIDSNVVDQTDTFRTYWSLSP